MFKLARSLLVVGSLVTASIVVNPQAALATCYYDDATGAQQSAGTSQYYGGWLNIYNYDHLYYMCTLGVEETYVKVAMPNLSYINFGFKQVAGMTPGSSNLFADYSSYPSAARSYTYGTASSAVTYSIRMFSSSIAGVWILEETAGSTFTQVDESPDMGKDTGVMSGYVFRGGGGSSDAALSTNWANTQNRYNGGWGHWTNEICAADSNIADWKMNLGTIGDFYTSNFTHSGVC